MSDLLRPGGAPPHRCEPPNLNLRIRHGAVWRCDCGRRYRLDVAQVGTSSWSGEWSRIRWPWPRRATA